MTSVCFHDDIIFTGRVPDDELKKLLHRHWDWFMFRGLKDLEYRYSKPCNVIFRLFVLPYLHCLKLVEMLYFMHDPEDPESISQQ